MTRRTDRVAEAIKRLVSEVIHTQLRDPRVQELVTVLKVELTPDLRFAKIYYSVLGDDKKKKLVAQGLKSAKNFIRKQIADELGLRYATDISFRFDRSYEKSEMIHKILNDLNKERKNEENRKNSADN